jgi:Raf kinase inhibitor-like YbhB/YbcL family protein
MHRALCPLRTLVILVSSCSAKHKVDSEAKGGRKMAITVKSSAFEHEGMIPSKYTCDGEDISPQLSWEGIPDGTKSIALISDDPDAPMGTWVHWILFNMPGDTRELGENVPKKDVLDSGAKHGKNGWGRRDYGGPCPPSGTHRYYFKIYALDAMLNLNAGAAKENLLAAMEGHLLAEGQVMGKYKRQ